MLKKHSVKNLSKNVLVSNFHFHSVTTVSNYVHALGSVLVSSPWHANNFFRTTVVLMLTGHCQILEVSHQSSNLAHMKLSVHPL